MDRRARSDEAWSLLDRHCYGGISLTAAGAGCCAGALFGALFGAGAALLVAGVGLFYLAVRRV